MLDTTVFAYNQTPTIRNLPYRQRKVMDPHDPQQRFTKDNAPQVKRNPEDKIREKSKRVLLHTKTVFPFQFFPTHVIVDVHRVVVVDQTFIFTDTIRSIPIGNIQYVRCDRALLFGTLRLRTYGFSDREVAVKYLWNRDALRARRLIEGLVICYEDNVDPLELDEKNICATLEQMGRENLG